VSPLLGVGGDDNDIDEDCKPLAAATRHSGPGRVRLGSPIVEVTCPRCSSVDEERYYGPCEPCRLQLREVFRTEGRVVDVAEYEPKMNVTPNAVASKED
jgi:hypothetical protein